jgi:hypothetical protein
VSAELATDVGTVVTVRELMQKIKAATEHMGAKNPHRELLFQCASAIFELEQRARGVERAYETLHKAAAEVLDAEEKAQRRVELVTL